MDRPKRHKARRGEYHEQWRAASARVRTRVRAVRAEQLEAMAKQLEKAVGSDKLFRTVKKLAAQRYFPFKIGQISGHEHTTTRGSYARRR